MDNALGEAQTIVLFGGTSDIGRAIVDALFVAGDDDGRARSQAAPTTSTPPTCERRGVTVDVVAVRRHRRPTDHARLVDRLVAAHGDLDVAVVAFGQLGDADALGRRCRRPRPPSSTSTSRGRSASARSWRRSSGARAMAAWSCCPASPASGCARPTTCTGRRRPGIDGFAQGLGDALAGAGAQRARSSDPDGCTRR